MEIHPPHAAAHSFRDFLIQLGTITAGVLIALSIEGLLEWNHYRTLVREARETIALEIAENKKELDGALDEIAGQKKNFETALRFANEMLTAKATDVRSIRIGFNLAELSTASWQSAERTGAVAHMEYADVRKYSSLYAMQALYEAQQRRSVERVAAASAILAEGSDPNLASARDLDLFRQQVLALRADLAIQEQIGRQLSNAYRGVLEE